MAGVAEEVLERAALDDTAVIHHDDLFGDIGNDAEIVRDDEDRHVEFALQVAHQLEDLRLDGDVERRGRLVGDEQRRLADQRHGDHRALTQAARQLEGIGTQRLGRMRKADQPQHFGGEVARFLLADVAMQLQGLADLIAHRVQR